MRASNLTVYQTKPDRFLNVIHQLQASSLEEVICCAGFELKKWRCDAFAGHLIEWIPEFALNDAELIVHHGNLYKKLKQAAYRIYTSPKYQKRGEAGEIALHAICRDFFDTVPISHRVFYKSTSNDVIKAFDMVHARFPEKEPMQIWLGESKLYKDGSSAVAEAIASVREHLEQGFLTAQKFILGPQIPLATPNYAKVKSLFEAETSLDDLIKSAVFPIGVFCDSNAVENAENISNNYSAEVIKEMRKLANLLASAKFPVDIKLLFIYVPLRSKDALVSSFDKN